MDVRISHKTLVRLTPGVHKDIRAPGLVCVVNNKRTIHYEFWYLSPSGAQEKIDLGSTITLTQARSLARAYVHKIVAGLDPRAQNTELHYMTFEQAAQQFLAKKSIEWRNATHRRQWRTTLSMYVYPYIGQMDINRITKQNLLKVLEPIWTTKSVTAQRVRQRIYSILDWAKAMGYRAGDNPADPHHGVGQLLPNISKFRRPVHLPAVPWQRAPELYEALRGDTVPHLVTEFLLLTAVRTSEAIKCTWSEIDMKARVWTIPGGRTKNKRIHRVPLSDRCVEILRYLKSLELHDAWVFPSAIKNKHVSIDTCKKQLKRIPNFEEFTPHGFRSTFRDWGAENTNFSSEALELSLGHVISNLTEAAYRRQDQLTKRFEIAESWATYLASGSDITKP